MLVAEVVELVSSGVWVRGLARGADVFVADNVGVLENFLCQLTELRVVNQQAVMTGRFIFSRILFLFAVGTLLRSITTLALNAKVLEHFHHCHRVLAGKVAL